MKLLKKILKISAIALILFVVLFCIFLSTYKFRKSTESILETLKEKGVNGEFQSLQSGGIKLNYLQTGTDSSALVFFIHGTPGSGADWTEYMSDSLLVNRATLVAVDRAGYGHSGGGPDDFDILRQTNHVKDILHLYRPHFKKIILVGHSYGGTIACKLAMDHPEWFHHVFQLAGQVSADHEKMNPFIKLGGTKWVYRMLSPKLKLATNEKLNHAEGIRKYCGNWHNIRMPYTIVHGDKDGLVPYENAVYAAQQLPDARFIRMASADHFIIWNRYEEIRDLIFKEL